jgi:hypothetical protein
MSNSTPIPIPPKLVWREFVTRYLPVSVFAVVLIAALVFWHQRLSPASILGEAETIQAIINAPDTGILTELSVRSFQQVKPGDVVGKLVINDPKVPTLLTAAIEGAVTYVHAAVGDRVKAGLPILTITGNKPDRIIAFLRQPIAFVPEEGAPVKIHPRARHKWVAVATIQRVGLQLAPIRPTLLPLIPARADMPHVEYGLPIIVSVPPQLKLFPGEIVDLTILSKPAPKPVPPTPPAKTNAVPAAATNAPATNAPPAKK